MQTDNAIKRLLYENENIRAESKKIVDSLLDENNTDNIFLSDENGQITEFEQMALIPLNKSIYCILRPYKRRRKSNDMYDFSVFRITDSNDFGMLEIVTDQILLNKIFKLYYDIAL